MEDKIKELEKRLADLLILLEIQNERINKLEKKINGDIIITEDDLEGFE